MTAEERGQGEDLVVVFRAPDEVTANLVIGLLNGEDIPALAQSRMVPWMDGVFKVDVGYWGDVVVPREHAAHSRELIQAYQDRGTDELPDDHR